MLQILDAAFPVSVRGRVFYAVQFCAFRSHDGLQVCSCDSPTSKALQALQGLWSLVVLAYVMKEGVSDRGVSCPHVNMSGKLPV